MTDNKDKRDEIITDLLIDAWDVARLLTEYEAHYQRGVEAGKAAASIDAEQLKAEFERGRDSYRDELLAQLADRHKVERVVAEEISTKAPIAKSIEEAPRPGRGPKPTDINRPEGIPSNFDMCRLVLIDAGKPLTATEIREAVARRWWPKVPTDWKSTPFGFLSSGKLRKSADNKFELGSGAATVVSREVLPRSPAKVPMPAVKPTAGPRPPAPVKFDHNGKSTIMRSMREYVLAGKLRAAMGKGHVGEGFLAQEVIGSNTENNREVVRSLCLAMNDQLAEVGLSIGHYPGFGLLMKDVVA